MMIRFRRFSVLALLLLLAACAAKPGPATVDIPAPTAAPSTVATAATPTTTLQITEIMYNPPARGGLPASEFIELYNAGATPLSLAGMRVTDGVDYTFAANAELAAGGYLVLADDVTNFVARYGFAPFAAFDGQLANEGERITLVDEGNAPLVAVRYNNKAPWPLTPDGLGFSLVLRAPGDLTQNPDRAAAWGASRELGGSPGAADPAPLPAVLVNEVLPHTDLPQVDAVELYNPGVTPADISYWTLTDDQTNPHQFQIPAGTVIAPQGYIYFTRDDLGFAFSELGEDAFLFSGDTAGTLTGYSHGFSFGASTNGVSFGRYITSDQQEHFPRQAEPTLGAPNAGPLVGPIVISTIHYRPTDPTDEYVELTNVSGSVVPLYDPLVPANRWRLDGIGSDVFPGGVMVEAGGKVLLVTVDPAEFRRRHPLPDRIQIIGPYDGGLKQNGERLSLARPETPNGDGTIPYIEIDGVEYGGPGWPDPVVGVALTRIDPAAYGADPANWQAAAPLFSRRTFLPVIVAAP